MKLSTSIISATLALGFVLYYLIWALLKRRRRKLEDCVTLFLGGPGLVGGILLLASMFIPSLLSQINEYEIYVGLGGLTLLFTIIQGVSKIFKR